MTESRRTAVGRSAIAAVALLLFAASPAHGQVRGLAALCMGDSGVTPSVECQEVALAAQAMQAGLGLAHTGGNPLTGGASTVGRRFGSTPRVALTGRMALTRFPVPDLTASTVGTAQALTPTLHAGATVGVFDGFSPAPTVGGLLSVDLYATVDVALAPEGKGFSGAVGAWGYGARIGVLRESFTLPGITLSVGQTRSGGVTLGDPDAALTPFVNQEVVTTAIRAVVGKELLGAGVLGGAGWDRYEGQGSIRARGGFPANPVLDFDGFTSDRLLFFGGLSRTILVLQISGEVGYARGFESTLPRLPGFDPGAGSYFGALSLRLTI